MKLKKKNQGFVLYSKLVSHSPQSFYLNFLNLQLQFGKIKKNIKNMSFKIFNV